VEHLKTAREAAEKEAAAKMAAAQEEAARAHREAASKAAATASSLGVSELDVGDEVPFDHGTPLEQIQVCSVYVASFGSCLLCSTAGATTLMGGVHDSCVAFPLRSN
jgi:hypothetical protein